MKKQYILFGVLSIVILASACSTAAQEQIASSNLQGIPDQTRIERNQNQLTGVNSGFGSSTETYLAAVSTRSEGDISSIDIQGLTFMREEEKLARDVYMQMADIWKINIFSNIARSEVAHMEAILNLMEIFEIEDPASETGYGVFQNQELQNLYDDLVDQGSHNLEEAILVGAAIEEIDIKDLQTYISKTSNSNLIQVYQNLLQGSINHLASFVRIYERQTGEIYEPQFLSQDNFENLFTQISFGGNGAGGQGKNGATGSRAKPW